MNKTVISLSDIVYFYSSIETRRVLNSVSFSLCRGERIALLGRNGSGKSTLLKIIAALLNPKSGIYKLNGKNIFDCDIREIRSEIGVVFQNPENQLIASILEDDVAFSPENLGLNSKEIQFRVDNALEKVGLSHKKNFPVWNLSGGEKQKAALAGVLASNANILLLDEVTSMLDPESRFEIEKILRELHKSGVTIIQATHQLEFIDDFDKIIVLSNGKILWHGSTDDFKSNAEVLGFNLENNICENQNKKHSDKVLFSIQDLSFKYDNSEKSGKTVFEKLNLEIKSGLWLSILGRTGTGKSTLIQHLNGLYKIQKGNIFYKGKKLPQYGEDLLNLRHKVGLVFQNPEEQIFSKTVEDEIAFAPLNAGYSKENVKANVLKAIRDVGLNPDFLNRNPMLMSGGEKRLIAIASVLSAEHECLILDEPLAGLDNNFSRKILNMLSELRDSGKTIITVTHDLNLAKKYSDELFYM